MSANISDISQDPIVREVLKALLLANMKKKKIIAEILSKLELKNILDIPYRSIDYSSESLCKCILFMKLKGLNQSNLEIYLKTHKNECKKLGLKRAPDQSNISIFIRDKINEESDKIIKIFVNIIEELAGKKGITLDAMQIKKKNRFTKRCNNYHRKNNMTRQVSKLFKRRILPFINFKLKDNCVYDEKIFTNMMLHIAKENDFSENGSHTLREDLKNRRRICPKCNKMLIPKTDLSDGCMDENLIVCLYCGYEDRISPLGATFRYHLKNNQSPSEILNMFIRTFEVLWDMLPDSKVFKKSAVTVAIDTTEWFYYGKKDNSYIVGKKPERGARYCYKFITIDIVQPGKRYTLLALPYTQLDTQQELLIKLLEFTRKRVKIKLALLDRGFFNKESIKILRNHRINFIMPCTEYSDIKKMLKVVPVPYIINDYCMGGEPLYNMAIIKRLNKRKREEELHAFATNIHLDENDIERDAIRIAEEYRKRWGIEMP